LRRQAADGRNPRDIKIELAQEIVSRFHGFAEAQKAHEGFISQFSNRAIPLEVPTVQVIVDQTHAALSYVMKIANLAGSTSEARRALAQRAVRVDETRIEDVEMQLQAGKRCLIQSGKRKFSFVELIQRN
jgi:tyrosyl-tRNA synthetase